MRIESSRRASDSSHPPSCALRAGALDRSWTPETLSLMMPGSLEEGLATGKAQFIPTLSSIMTLLSARSTSDGAWAHLFCLNLFVAASRRAQDAGAHPSTRSRAANRA